jgi:phytoene dehydrogenase-like protein
MSADERYDVVIVGGGHNGTAAAAYLAKCGLSVCVLEERPEGGGAHEQVEVIPGVRINPCAIVFYGAAAPGLEQLELWKYGFRIYPGADIITLLKTRWSKGIVGTTEGGSPITEKDATGFAKLSGLLTQPPFTTELLRSFFWTPPPPPEVEVTPENIPFMQVYKERQPDVWSKELLEMTLFELLDEYCETEPFKVAMAVGSWYSGSAGHYEGVAIPALLYNIALLISSRFSIPQGGVHVYHHAIVRAAQAHGAVFHTCCPVDEILISNGRAVGVRLRDDSALGEKKIWANKAVISATDVKQTFLNLIGPQHLDPGFIQRIKDLSVKGSSAWISHFLTREKLRVHPKFGDTDAAIYPCDSREIYYELVADVEGRKGNPTIPPERVQWVWFSRPRMGDPIADPQCTIPNRYLEGQFYFYLPPPEYHVESPDAINKIKDKMENYILKALSQVFENIDPENIVHHWQHTPYDQEFRNRGLIGGGWGGLRHCKDQLWINRPLPELSRYRVPGIDGLYLCHMTSGHPGLLCIMAIPYNLMHILIEDGIAEPGDWWYPSPWYIPQQGKKSAIPG